MTTNDFLKEHDIDIHANIFNILYKSPNIQMEHLIVQA